MNIWTFTPAVREVKATDGSYNEFVDIRLADVTVWTDKCPCRSSSTNYEPDLTVSMERFADALADVMEGSGR